VSCRKRDAATHTARLQNLRSPNFGLGMCATVELWEISHSFNHEWKSVKKRFKVFLECSHNSHFRRHGIRPATLSLRKWPAKVVYKCMLSDDTKWNIGCLASPAINIIAWDMLQKKSFLHAEHHHRHRPPNLSFGFHAFQSPESIHLFM
jgi:hypothetical protein